jgi:hypothetical protein
VLMSSNQPFTKICDNGLFINNTYLLAKPGGLRLSNHELFGLQVKAYHIEKQQSVVLGINLQRGDRF